MSLNNSLRIPENIKWYIISERQRNTEISTIIQECKSQFNRAVSRQTVWRLFNKFQRTASTTNLQSPGRPKTLSKRDERSLVRSLLQNQGLSLRAATIDPNINPQGASRRTLRRAVRGRGLVPKTTRRGREISEKNKKVRLEYAKEHQNWTQDD